jgi:voltage-gated potassium channel
VPEILMTPRHAEDDATPRARRLRHWQRRTELPLLVLSVAWITLFVVDEVRGLSPLLSRANDAIWITFVAAFVVEVAISPDRALYLRRNWVSALSLLLPALRVFRVFRVLRFARAAGWLRGLRFARVLGTFNRGMRMLGRSLGRRGAGYVVALTLLVTLVGAAGMHAFEREAGGPGFGSFADTLWWTAMIMTTMGSEAWPQSTAGRVLCLLLSLYAFAVFGYVTAVLASFFVGRDAAPAPADDGLRAELQGLRDEVRSLREHLARGGAE